MHVSMLSPRGVGRAKVGDLIFSKRKCSKARPWGKGLISNVGKLALIELMSKTNISERKV